MGGTGTVEPCCHGSGLRVGLRARLPSTQRISEHTLSAVLLHHLPKAPGLTSAFPVAGRAIPSAGQAAFIQLRVRNHEVNTAERVVRDFPDIHTLPFGFLFPQHASNDVRQQDSQGNTPKESQPVRVPR